MSETVIVGMLSLAGTLIGTLGGIMASNKLTTFRIQKLEEKVDKHNSMIERVYKLEGRVTEAEHDIRDMKARAS